MHLWSELRWSVLDPAWVASVFPKAATGFKGVTLWQKNREQKRDREGKEKRKEGIRWLKTPPPSKWNSWLWLGSLMRIDNTRAIATNRDACHHWAWPNLRKFQNFIYKLLFCQDVSHRRMQSETPRYFSFWKTASTVEVIS